MTPRKKSPVLTAIAAIRHAEYIWSSGELPEELAVEGQAKRADLALVIERYDLHGRVSLLHEAMLLATEQLWYARTFPRPVFTRRVLKQQATNLKRALRVMEARHDTWPVELETHTTLEQVFGNDPAPMPAWQLRGGLRHELERVQDELTQKRTSRLRRDDLRAAAQPLRTFWVKTTGGSHKISSKDSGHLSKTGQFLYACLVLLDQDVTERLIADLDK